jgi:parallel beta-helix repeat protein
MGLHVVILDIGRLQIMNIRVHVQGVVCLICGLALLGSLVHAQRSEADTYYVTTNGRDSNPGTEDQPFRTLDRGAWALMPGDTLYVKNGTYTGTLAFFGIPSGTSWDNPVTIAAYPGHSPVLQPSPDDYVFYISYTSYMVINGFLIDGTNGNVAGIKITDGASHIRIQNSEVAYTADGIEVNDGAEGNEFMNLQLHDNTYYGIYIASSNNVVEGCSIHNNGGYGIHAYSGAGEVNNNLIRNNEIYNNGQSGNGQSGIIISRGDGNQVYDNIIWGNVGGIWVDYGASNSYISGNTIYGNTWVGIYIGPGSSKTFIGVNNIYDNYGPSIIDNGVSTQILP